MNLYSTVRAFIDDEYFYFIVNVRYYKSELLTNNYVLPKEARTFKSLEKCESYSKDCFTDCDYWDVVFDMNIEKEVY